ncbi:hypothetical protein AKJ40_04150 [candidate division MSBL1 archaeon SCGC-AAA259M10]|uniref:Uncharacterized protein n=1 Tax=candidate division MSBL1 archaeon SCGC-AAA259M10 TaxID=1698270 RepID=A0A133UXV7_9EURY|nr:hypothetical protein AKJ40_04150 [candidate division MSBL1 archaeon SCGC-AAA259M10]
MTEKVGGVKMTDEVVCAVPGCDNLLIEKERNGKKAVCSTCEAEGLHLCDLCGKRMSTNRIRSGATLCKECEMNPSGMETTEAEMTEYGLGSDLGSYMA